jgi:hypothetical protein
MTAYTVQYSHMEGKWKKNNYSHRSRTPHENNSAEGRKHVTCQFIEG